MLLLDIYVTSDWKKSYNGQTKWQYPLAGTAGVTKLQENIQSFTWIHTKWHICINT